MLPKTGDFNPTITTLRLTPGLLLVLERGSYIISCHLLNIKCGCLIGSG